MRLEQLKYIVTIAENMSFSKASNKLFLSPQALSRSMTALEKELGVIIFTRFATGVQLTLEGEMIAAMAKNMLKEYEHTMNHIQNRKNQNSRKTVYLYTHNTYTEAYLNHIVLNFMNAESNIRIVIKEFNGTALRQIRKKQEKDEHDWVIFIALREGIFLPLEERMLKLKNVQYITDEKLSSKYIACVDKNSLLARQKEVSLKMLNTIPFVKFSVDGDEQMTEMDFIDIYFKGHHIESSHSVNNLGSWLSAIADGYGVGIIDGMIYRNQSQCRDWFDKVHTLPVTDSINISHNFVTSIECPEEVMKFIEFAVRELKNMV